MNIYLVEGTVRGYDTYDRFICTAPDEGAARRMHPNGWLYFFDGRGWYSESNDHIRRIGDGYVRDWNNDINDIRVTLLGQDTTDAGQRIILASYNAG